jgi:tripartite-type tricarboxylate transporter receptor subunit TctC
MTPNAQHPTSLLKRRTLLNYATLALGAGLGGAMSSTWAQAEGTIRVVVPFTPGASNDVIGRMIAEAMARSTNRSWIVDNKPGAGSLLGADFVAKAEPDGRNLLLCASANMGILPAIRKSMPYVVERDFTFIARVASSPFALVSSAELPVATFADFVRLAKAKPGALRIGSSGVGALDYMGASMLQSLLGIELNIIPYKGMSQVLNDLRAGHIDASIVSPATIAPMAKEGKVKVLAVLDKQRSAVMPDVPSSADVGQPKLIVMNWWGIAGPAKMPAATTANLLKTMGALLADQSFLNSLKAKGFEPAVLVGEPFTQFIAADLQAWKAVAKQSNISLDN